MPKIELTDAERLILANQYQILSILEKDDDYDQLARNLRDGHKWLYQDQLQLSANLPDVDVQHVLDILDLYRLLKSSFEELDDKAGIDIKRLNFPGFDGNNESELLHFAGALSRSGRYLEEIGNPAKNSHHPTNDLYNRMLGEWRRLGEPSYPLSADAIKAILGA